MLIKRLLIWMGLALGLLACGLGAPRIASPTSFPQALPTIAAAPTEPPNVAREALPTIAPTASPMAEPTVRPTATYVATLPPTPTRRPPAPTFTSLPKFSPTPAPPFTLARLYPEDGDLLEQLADAAEEARALGQKPFVEFDAEW
jgi:hypothetical protein